MTGSRFRSSWLLGHALNIAACAVGYCTVQGDGSGLRVVDTPAGRISTLICFENHMPLARFALYTQGIDLYVAPTVAYGEVWLSATRHIAIEGGCWVLSCGTALHSRDIPADLPARDRLFGDAWLHDGDSVIVDPMGTVVAGPLHQAHGILYAECTPEQTVAMRRLIDVAGHYGRPDIFHLAVDRTPRAPIHFHDESRADPWRKSETDAENM